MKPKISKKIILDIDGVLLNFLGGITSFAEEYLGRKIIIHGKYFDLEHRFGLPKEKIDEIWDAFGESGGWGNLKPFPGAKEAVKEIIDAGFTPYVVTGIKEKYREQRLINLERDLDFIPHQIYCTGDGKAPKDKLIETINPDVFIDDNLLHLHKVHGVFHLGWIDHSEEQFPEKEKGVDSSAHSIKDWVDRHLAQVSQEVNEYHHENKWVQRKLRFI